MTEKFLIDITRGVDSLITTIDSLYEPLSGEELEELLLLVNGDMLDGGRYRDLPGEYRQYLKHKLPGFWTYLTTESRRYGLEYIRLERVSIKHSRDRSFTVHALITGRWLEE